MVYIPKEEENAILSHIVNRLIIKTPVVKAGF